MTDDLRHSEETSAGLEDERLRRLLPFVRRIDREVFGQRLEPACQGGR
ncbi:MAG: hypothetical protein ABIK09_17415 [Pseudomonadota bacterium]